MINLKKLRGALKDIWNERGELLPDSRINIKRKKKMIIEKTTNGNTRAVRRSYLSIEIIE